MKFKQTKYNSNLNTEKNPHKFFSKRLPFPILLCIAIIIAGSFIYYSITSTEGGINNSGGFNFDSEKTHLHKKAKATRIDSTDEHNSVSEEKGASNSKSSGNNNIDDKKNIANKEKTTKNSDNKGKTWVPPVYKYVNHPAVTRSVTTYSCKGGSFTSMDALRSAQQNYIRKNHLPGWDGTFSNIQSNVRTEVVKEAWTEKVLVKEGYWK